MYNSDLTLIPVTYVVFPTTAYNENAEQQHTNCSNSKMESSTVLVCGGGSILADGIKGNINTKDGLQTFELQQFFTWNIGHLNTLPFVSIVFGDAIVPHSIDLYFHFSPDDFRINIPKITLYWSNNDPLDTQNILQFQRMAYQIGSGMYKYKAILEVNNTMLFGYIQIKMEPAMDDWIFLSEIKVYAKKTKGIVIESNQ